jgi:hypothetical protein
VLSTKSGLELDPVTRAGFDDAGVVTAAQLRDAMIGMAVDTRRRALPLKPERGDGVKVFIMVPEGGSGLPAP